MPSLEFAIIEGIYISKSHLVAFKFIDVYKLDNARNLSIKVVWDTLQYLPWKKVLKSDYNNDFKIFKIYDFGTKQHVLTSTWEPVQDLNPRPTDC